MTVNFSNCDTLFEQVIFIVPAIAIVALIFAAFIVFNNQKSSESLGGKIKFELLGGLDVFFTRKYLNEKGRKWWPIFICAFYSVVFGFLILGNFGICEV